MTQRGEAGPGVPARLVGSWMGNASLQGFQPGRDRRKQIMDGNGSG